MNNLQVVIIPDTNFDQKGGRRRLRCLSELTLVFWVLSAQTPASHALQPRASPSLPPRATGPGTSLRDGLGWVLPVSQRLGLSFHSSSRSVFSEDLYNYLVNKKSKNYHFHL